MILKVHKFDDLKIEKFNNEEIFNYQKMSKINRSQMQKFQHRNNQTLRIFKYSNLLYSSLHECRMSTLLPRGNYLLITELDEGSGYEERVCLVLNPSRTQMEVNSVHQDDKLGVNANKEAEERNQKSCKKLAKEMLLGRLNVKY